MTVHPLTDDDEAIYQRLCMLISEAGYSSEWVNRVGRLTDCLTVTATDHGKEVIPAEVCWKAFDLAYGRTLGETEGIVEGKLHWGVDRRTGLIFAEVYGNRQEDDDASS